MSFWDRVANARYVDRPAHGMGGKFDGIRRSALQRIGGFDECAFFSAGEDCDLLIRLEGAGRIVRSDVHVVHAHRYPAHTSLRSLFRKQRQLGEGFGALVRRHGRRMLMHDMRHLVFAHGLKLVLFLLLPVWPVTLLAAGGLLVLALRYSGRALWVADARVLVVPFVQVALFGVFLVGALTGWRRGRQAFDYNIR
jgi:cellulose synthase/poly-beta-1,6-N-acetylglucosamine synthase-like glycosyltransferase